MIHPDTGNIISVCDKFSLFISNDRGICSVNADTAIVGNDHLTHYSRIHDQECKTVLPEISPSPSAFSIVVVWEKRTAIDSSQHRLKADPFHIVVGICITGFIRYIYFFLPVGFHLFKSVLHLLFCSVFYDSFGNTLFLLCQSCQYDKTCCFLRLQFNIRKADASHCLFSLSSASCHSAWLVLSYCFRIQISTALSYKLLHSRIKRLRCIAFF